MAEVLTDDKYYNDIAAAIRSRYGGTTKYFPKEMAAAITETTDEIGTVEEKDINFYDFDGTLFASYTFEEASVLKEYPRIPHYDDTLLKGWTASLDTIRSVNYKLDVGAIRRSDDDATKLYLEIASTDDLSVTLSYSQTVANDVEIDWGDGSSVECSDVVGSTIALSHTYADIGSYTISIFPKEGEFTLVSIDKDIVIKLICGKSIQTVGCSGLVNLQNIVMSDDMYHTYSSFDSCTGLSFVSVPSVEVGCIGAYSSLSDQGTFKNCTSLGQVILSEDIGIINYYAFDGCTNLTSITIPNNVAIRAYAFNGCTNLKHIVIPEGVTLDDGNYGAPTDWMAFNAALSAGAIGSNSDFQFGWKYTIPKAAFRNFNNLTHITLPDTLLSIGTNAFYGCSNLTSLHIPDSVTTIGDQAFSRCVINGELYLPASLVIMEDFLLARSTIDKLIIGENVTTIRPTVFYSFSVNTVVIKSATPPTVFTSNNSLYSATSIYVPDDSVESYKSATWWSTYADKIKPISEYTE